MALEFVKLVKGKDVISQVGSFGFFKLGVESGGGDIEFSRVFSENSPATISAIGDEISAKGMTSAQVEEAYGWKLGDTTDIKLTNDKTITMRIIGFNQDALSDGSGNAGITLQLVGNWGTVVPYNTSRPYYGGYAQSTIRNSTLVNIKQFLPQEILNVIKTVNKACDKGFSTGGSYLGSEILQEELFLLSEYEVLGKIVNSNKSASDFQYEYWSNPTNYVPGEVYEDSWWFRSVKSTSQALYCTLSLGSSYNLYNNNLSVSFAFCVGGGASSGGGTGGDTPSFSTTFGENTPEQISAVSALISANNMTSADVETTYGWKIGDTISYQLTTGENVEMRIIGFNHDEKSDGSGKAGITLEMVNCLAERYSMNTVNTGTGGYPSSTLRNETLPTIKATLPQEWQDVIKIVNKKSATGPLSSNRVVTSSEDLFILSQIEVTNSTTNTRYGADEGVQYAYYKGTDATFKIKKRDEDGDGVPETARYWWVRSCRASSASTSTRQTFCAISSSGIEDGGGEMSLYGVSFAFCI